MVDITSDLYEDLGDVAGRGSSSQLLSIRDFQIKKYPIARSGKGAGSSEQGAGGNDQASRVLCIG